MQVFDINKSKMEESGNLYDRAVDKLDTYLFAYP
jgi:hypothetical protein